MKHSYDTLRVFLFTFFGLGLLWVVYSALHQISFQSKATQQYTIQAAFDDLKQLQLGDDVRMAGICIGNVTNTAIQSNKAVAILSIDKKFAIPSDSIATISMAGLLGAQYISIVPGNSSTAIPPNGNLRTQTPFDIGSMVQKFGSIGDRLDRILSGFDPNPSEKNRLSLFQEIGEFFHENRQKLDQIVDNCSHITEKISQGGGTLGKFIFEEDCYQNLSDTLQSFHQISQEIQKGNGIIGKMIYDPQMAQSFDELTKNLREFSERLNNEKSTLGRIISDDTLYKKAEAAIDKVDGAVNSVSNSGPITAVGAAASAIF